VTVGGRLTPLPPFPPGLLVQRAQPPPFPLGEPRCRLYARARHGLWDAMRAAGLGPGDTVLAPAFHHGSEIEAFHQAGLGCRFYEVTTSASRSNRRVGASGATTAVCSSSRTPRRRGSLDWRTRPSDAMGT
jgi:hypothetical protein